MNFSTAAIALAFFVAAPIDASSSKSGKGSKGSFNSGKGSKGSYGYSGKSGKGGKSSKCTSCSTETLIRAGALTDYEMAGLRTHSKAGKRGSCERVHGSFTGSQNSLPGGQRLNRDGAQSTCSPPKAFPGLWSCSTCQYLEFNPYYYKDGSPEGCLTIDFDMGTCFVINDSGSALNEVHLMAYNQPFDPSDLSLGYLGDVGSSLSQTFEIPYARGSLVYIVALTNYGPVQSSCDFSFAFGWSKCASSIAGFANATTTTAIEDLPEGSYDTYDKQ